MVEQAADSDFMKEASQRDGAAAFFSISQHCQQRVYSTGYQPARKVIPCLTGIKWGGFFQVRLEIAFSVLN